MSLTPSVTYHKTAGFTLIEVIITIIIMGFAAIIITPYLTAVTHHPDPVIREKAIALGQAMMDEILAKKWDENTANGGGPICTSESQSSAGRISITSGCNFSTSTSPLASAILGADGVETRGNFNDVDDYNGLLEPGVFFDQTGALIPGTWAGFSRSVLVEYIASNSANIDATTPLAAGTITDSKRIVVTVSSPLGETFNLVAVACNF